MTDRLAKPTAAADTIATILFASSGVLVLAYTISAWVVGPSMYADQGTGFLALRSWLQGGPFNEIAVPDPADISRDLGFFVAWWSPGQYMVPALFQMLGLGLGHAITAVLFLSAVANLVGLHLLYRQWGFPRLSIALTLFLQSGSRLFSHQFDIYGGGEVLLAAAMPWFVLLILRFREMTPLKSVVLFLAIAFMTFLKLSGLVLAVALVGAVELMDLMAARPDRIKRLIRRAILVGLPFLVFAILFQIFWASRGETPTTAAANVFSPMRLLTHAVPAFVACFTSILSAGDFAAATLMRPGHVLIRTLIPFYFAMALPVGFLIYVVRRQLARTHPDYLRFAAILTVIYWLIMSILYVRGGEVSLEDRQFRQVGMVLAIGVVHAALQWRLPFRLAVAAVASVLIAYGGASWFQKLQRNTQSARGEGGIRHMVLSPSALAFVRGTLDQPLNGSSLVVISSGEIALEFHTRRTVEIPADFREPADLAKRYVFKGRVDHLGVLLQNKLVDEGKAAIVLAEFKDYPVDGWKKVSLGDFTYYSQDRP